MGNYDNIITGSIRKEREYVQILKTASEQANSNKPLPVLVTGLSDGSRFSFYAALAEDLKLKYGRGYLLIAADEKDVLRLANSFSDLGYTPLTYPVRDFIFYNITASHDYEHERLAVLASVLNGRYDVIITTLDAAVQYTIPRDILSSATKHIRKGDIYKLEELTEFLNFIGYARVEMVDGTGQFSIHGGILDIYPPQSEYPVRMDFFDEEIEQMSIFDIITQRRIEFIDGIDLSPAREILLTKDKKSELQDIIKTQIRRAKDENTREILGSELESLAADTEINFADKYISAIYPEKFCLLDYFDDNPIYVLQEYNAVTERFKSFEWHMKQSIEDLLNKGAINSKYVEYNKWQADAEYFIYNKAGIIVDVFVSGNSKKLSGLFNFLTKQTFSYADNIELLIDDINIYRNNSYNILLMTENELMAKNIQGILNEIKIPSVLNANELTPTVPLIIWGKNLMGFELTITRFACLSLYANPNSLSRTVSGRKKRSSKKKLSQEKVMSYADLNVGDYIVHQNHGIGQYLGLQTLMSDGIIKEYIKIQYHGTDMLYLPCNQLDTVSKYIGAKTEDGTVKLSKMGGAEWGKAKARAKSAAKAMAKDLIKLYAERLRHEGYPFAQDDELQKEFDMSFEFEETDGQLVAIDEIKRDMERSIPMDRLLCGDVGFGKTEVALRAAFKAVNSSKQAAILVPTTILAMQHYQTLQ
ncbi:MAG: DEAD/DEAH box helicase, partial [Oscillospiraceae bacterium]|nr:DEAD/DEAH box helicase [Oscillospiraceae bacterium]